MTAREYTRYARRYKAYKRALHRFLYEDNPDKAAAILPRLKIAEAEEAEMFKLMKNG